MSNHEKTPIELLTDALAAMTERAIRAEKERDDTKTRNLEWYKRWETKDREHKETQAALAAEIREHQTTKAELGEAMDAVNKLSAELEALRKAQKTPSKA